MDLKGSRTEANLMSAFAGETQARTKYTYYAAQAKKDGYLPVEEERKPKKVESDESEKTNVKKTSRQ